MMQEYGSQDVMIATQGAIRSIFGNVEIYAEGLPASGVRYPHFEIRELQVTPVQGERTQSRGQFRRDNYFMTVKWRAFGGASLPPVNLQAQFRNTRHGLAQIKRLKLQNSSVPVEWTSIEPEAMEVTGMTVLGGYFNVRVLVKIPAPEVPLQENLVFGVPIGAALESKFILDNAPREPHFAYKWVNGGT